MHHELNARVAREVMGLGPPDQAQQRHYHFPGENTRYSGRYSSYSVLLNIPDFSGCMNAAHEMEKEIERRGNIPKLSYLEALEEVLGNPSLDEPYLLPYSIWAYVHATPEQRCEAALEAVRGDK